MNHSPDIFVYTDMEKFASGEAYAGLYTWNKYRISLAICPNTRLVDCCLAEMISGTPRYTGNTYATEQIMVEPGQKKYILVTRGRQFPPDVRMELYVFGTDTLYANPVPIVAVHHAQGELVFDPASFFSAVVPRTYIKPIVPPEEFSKDSSWIRLGYSDVIAERVMWEADNLDTELVLVRPVVRFR